MFETMAKVLISTVYGPDPVLLACTKLSPDRLVLLVTDEDDSVISDSLKLIRSSLGRVLDVAVVTIPQYDIIRIAEIVVSVIEEVSLEDEIVVNITSGRKTQSVGVLFGAYARKKHVKKIAYYPEGEEKGSVVYLPILSMELTESQAKIVASIKANKVQSYKSLADATGLSSAMVYRAVDELLSEGLVEKVKDEGIILTDAGYLRTI